MRRIRKHAAGIDIGAKKIFVAVEGQKVRCFDTFTESFEEARAYLLTHGIQTVAMEATGVYWIVLYEILDRAGLDVWLVDGRQVKQVPGRKTDIKDCQWIQQLHSYGLLNRCYVPETDVKEMRSYTRLREDHIRSSSMHINHMQKALTEMNIRLKEVLSQIHGASGLVMINAILEGERDPKKLLSMCHGSIKKHKAKEVLKALKGHYTEAGLFALQQAYESYCFYHTKIKECDRRIEKLMEKVNDRNPTLPSNQLVKDRKPVRHHKPEVKHLGKHLIKLFAGNDATDLPGITDYTWLQLYGEVGNDLTRWKTEKHFTSWLGLAPGQHCSGKKKKNISRKHHPQAAQIFRKIARSLIESKRIALGAFGRRIKARRGPGIATKATARKLAVLYWRLMVKGVDYVEEGIKAYEEKVQSQRKKWFLKTAKELGYNIAVTGNSAISS